MPERILATVATVGTREKAVTIVHYLHKFYRVVANLKIIGANIYEVNCQCENQKQVEHLKEITKALVYGLNLRKDS